MTERTPWPTPVRQGKTWTLAWTYTDGDGEPIDLTDAIIVAQLRPTWADDDTATPLLDLDNGPGGAITVDTETARITTTVDATDTEAIPYGSYLLEWEIALSDGVIDGLPVWVLDVLPEVVREVPGD